MQDLYIHLFGIKIGFIASGGIGPAFEKAHQHGRLEFFKLVLLMPRMFYTFIDSN